MVGWTHLEAMSRAWGSMVVESRESMFLKQGRVAPDRIVYLETCQIITGLLVLVL